MRSTAKRGALGGKSRCQQRRSRLQYFPKQHTAIRVARGTTRLLSVRPEPPHGSVVAACEPAVWQSPGWDEAAALCGPAAQKPAGQFPRLPATRSSRARPPDLLLLKALRQVCFWSRPGEFHGLFRLCILAAVRNFVFDRRLDLEEAQEVVRAARPRGTSAPAPITGPSTDGAPERVRVRVIYLKILPSGA